ncbi:hypothetical protein BCIN_04g03820 [Botrytis cinerea B05.10]|uniref:Uncharacterized protein n=1 Tax=Botryotinia fuckeliana (strain B05.10) TaxID=332648 RepID=A0A384JFX7_BOTFB|nr:hypothetical protein BCIN_04g03820 [Botrytis cinerea B05.10]ATZ49204.1 hypothetical protein BCIN_04g03820 [Botrytis cinerea B05.10]
MKKTKRSCYPIVICILIIFIALLGVFIGFLLIHPGVIGMSCSTQVKSPQPSSPVHFRTMTRPFYNTTTTTTQSTSKTNPKTQATATGTPSGIDPVAIATCLGVLENACATNNSRTTFVCQPMKKFCSRAIPLNRIPLAEISP